MKNTRIIKRFSDLIYLRDLVNRKCGDCDQLFTQPNYTDDNFLFKAESDINWLDFPEDKSVGDISIRISIKHSKCPEIKQEKSTRKPRQDYTIKDYPN